jgi:aspartate/methionine/tyrosine aminotransferase
MKQLNNKPVSKSVSAEVMETFIEQSPDFHEPAICKPVPGMPTLPELKSIAQARAAEGLPTIDQSAGDIAALDQPMSPEFLRWREHVRDTLKDKHGELIFPRTSQNVHGFPDRYQMIYPGAVEKMAESWGISGRVLGVQTNSGRNALSMVFHALRQRALRLQKTGSLKKGKLAIILDPFAWSGYIPLAKDLDFELVYAPTEKGHSLAQSASGLRASLAIAKDMGLIPAGVVPVIPSNPTGLTISREELHKLAVVAAAARVPLLVDAFYSPLAPQGHRNAVNFDYLEKKLPPNALEYMGLLVGETKVTDSQIKTATIIFMAPESHDAVAGEIVTLAKKRMSATNTYPTPPAALTAFALHSYPGGIHEAMGKRWEVLESARRSLRQMFDDLGLPFTIDASFYGVAALVDGDGNSLIRDGEGRPITDPIQIIQELIKQQGIVGAPGITFRSSESGGKTIRLTATATPRDIERLRDIIGGMIEKANQHG